MPSRMACRLPSDAWQAASIVAGLLVSRVPGCQISAEYGNQME